MTSAPLSSSSSAQVLRGTSVVDCRHCGQVHLAASSDQGFCCAGCRAVFELLSADGLDRYYELRGNAGSPAVEPGRSDHAWIAESANTVDSSIRLDIQGVHCAACVWLVEELFERQGCEGAVYVNPALGRLELNVQPSFPLRKFVEDVERFGYRLGPRLKEQDDTTDDLLLRLGICVALAGNSMLFAIATYLGLKSGPVFEFVMQLQYAMAAVAVVVGGQVFIRSAWAGIRQRVLSLDLPIALGIVLAFMGSSYAFFRNEGDVYFDTICTFIALMVFGRWLSERVVRQNRKRILASEGTDGLLTTRLVDGRPEVARSKTIQKGDELLIASGDLVPVRALLISAAGRFSLDWINGESAPKATKEGEEVSAGAFNASPNAVRVQAEEPFLDSDLVALLSHPRQGLRKASTFWDRLSKRYVILVLAAALIGFVGWALAGQVHQGVEVAIAVLVVTCPCAFGIATPFAYELVQARLRRVGLFVRNPDLLDRLRAVKQVMFDKTGTLTESRLVLSNASALESLREEEAKTLFDMVSRSTHPKSAALRRALTPRGFVLSDVEVEEEIGRGLSCRLGTARFELNGGDGQRDAGVQFRKSGELLAEFYFDEKLRPGAAEEVSSLVERGLTVGILSGDNQGQVTKVAVLAGVEPGWAKGGLGPEAKAQLLLEMDNADTLFIGDGVNDALAADVAWVSGTPAIDRPFMAARTDFYLASAGLAPVTQALRAAFALVQTVRLNLALAVVYNTVAVATAYAGWMEPWMAAVLMPVSSVSTLALTGFRLRAGSPAWRS